MTPGPLTLLVNPRADHGRPLRTAHRAEEVLARRGHRVSIPVVQSPAAVRRTAAQAVQNGDPAIIVVGGDGMCHLVIQEIAGTSTALGIIPVGTGNDFAAGLGLLRYREDAAHDIADCLAAVTLRRTVDLARCGQTWWASVLCAGFDSAVTVRANKMRWPRGPHRYDLALIAELVRLRAVRMRVDLDDRSVEVDATLIAVGNTSSYGGGIRICPRADPADGLLDVTIVGRVSRAELIRATPTLRRGDHLAHPAVRAYRARRVAVHGPANPPVIAFADGEPIQELPVTATCHPDALQVLQDPRDR